MGMFDWYQPTEPTCARCQVCGNPLTEWQGKDGPCFLYVWKQGNAHPVDHPVDDDSRMSQADLGTVILPDQFEIYSYDCPFHKPIVANCRCVDSVWCNTAIVRTGAIDTTVCLPSTVIAIEGIADETRPLVTFMTRVGIGRGIWTHSTHPSVGNVFNAEFGSPTRINESHVIYNHDAAKIAICGDHVAITGRAFDDEAVAGLVNIMVNEDFHITLESDDGTKFNGRWVQIEIADLEIHPYNT